MSKKKKSNQIKLIFNPGAGNAADAAEKQRLATGYLEQNGRKVKVALARPKEKATTLAQQAVKEGYPIVVAMGGDGTVEAVMRGLLGSPTRLGIIPTGIENNLAHSLGIPEDLKAACDLIASDQTLNLDLGQVTTAQGRKFLFFEMATIGPLAAAAPKTQKPAKGKTSGLQLAAMTLIRQESRPKVFLTLDEERKIEVDTLLVTVSIAPVLGKNFPTAPAVTRPDGLLDISVYPGLGKAELLRDYGAMMDGGAVDESKIEHYRARKIKVKTSPKLVVSADGVALGQGTVTLKVRKAALRIIAAKQSPAAPPEVVETLAFAPVLQNPGKNHHQNNVTVPG
jgi:diacylglycerol kinase (ATP)